MKTIKKIALVITGIALFASCQSNPNVKKILASTETRKELMDSIASSASMSKEMMAALMNEKNGKMMMDHHQMMMTMMKDKPEMMKNMMDMSKADAGMMCPMCGKMMGMDKMDSMAKKMPDSKNPQKKDEH